MLVSDYNYDLPEERIAKFPPEKRGETRLLVLNRENGEIKDSHYRDLADFLNPGDVLILNDTKVMPARIFATLPDGRKRELIVLENHHETVSKVMYRGKLHAEDILTVVTPAVSTKKDEEVSNEKTFSSENDKPQIKVKQILGNGLAEVESAKSLTEIAEKYGEVPLPPYLHRNETTADRERYQTVWAKNVGSAAAPTASLNMTAELLEKLRSKGVKICYLTLHVGLGTFLPMRTDKIEDHKMHSEWFEIPEETVKVIRGKEASCRIVAVGTTVARTLEFYAKTGLTYGEDDIFIYPGFKFQMVDVLLTNFHAPKSTVLMLAAAFAGWENLHQAYTHAIKEKYNFLSYGDSMLILSHSVETGTSRNMTLPPQDGNQTEA